MRALWIVGLVACSASAPDPRDAGGKSGSRLIAERWTADGVSWFAGWYDSELGTRCRWQETVDRWRCMPSELVPSYFADAACTKPAYSGGSGCAPYAGAARVGAKLSRVYGLIESTLCTPITVPVPDHYAAGEPLPLDRFVGATIKTWGDEISVKELHGDDGSIERITLDRPARYPFLAARPGGYNCELRMTGSQTAICAGAETRAGAVRPHYLDAQCTQLSIFSQGFSRRINIDYEAEPCAPTPFYQVRDLVSVATEYFLDDNGTCTPLTTVPQVHPIDEIVDANVALTLQIDNGTSRLRFSTWVSDTGETWPGPLFDTQMLTPCVPRASNGSSSARCVPALNERFRSHAVGNTAGTCDPPSQLQPAAACWGQTVRATQRRDGSCGIPQYDLERAEGRVIEEPFYVGLGPQALWPECVKIDTIGLELREGGYTPNDGADYVGMQLVRDGD